MKIAMIGTGNVGKVLGRRWAQKGHQVIFGTREPDSEKIKAVLEEAGANASAATLAEAAAQADLIALATPWGPMEAIIQSMGDLTGKILIDCTNPLSPDRRQLALGFTTSGAEQIAAWAAGARVVKAFNTTGAGNMADPVYASGELTMFICGDEPATKQAVAGLVNELDFEAIDVGPLEMARYLEPLAVLWVKLAYVEGLGPNFAIKLVRR
jgi:NADPH-dependent F420 reductase